MSNFPTGGLIQLDVLEFGKFYDDLVRAFKAFKAVKANMNMWVTPRGDGLLTPTAAGVLVALIKNTMDGKGVTKGGAPVDWTAPDPEWQSFKESYGTFSTPWKFTGAVYRNVIATRRGNANIVGIDRRARVRKMGYGGKRGKSVSVDWYAGVIERGYGKIPERPLFTACAAHFITTKVPALEELVRKSLHISKGVFESYGGSRHAMGEMHGGSNVKMVMGEAVNVAQGMDPDRDFSSELLRDAQIDAALNGAGDDQRQLREMKARNKREVNGFMAANGVEKEHMSPELLRELAKLGYT